MNQRRDRRMAIHPSRGRAAVLAGAALLAVFGLSAHRVPVPAPDPPNIVLILTDDQGYGDLGFHGNPDIRTPELDRLARESTRFTHFYVSPVCAPTRSSLMTGRYSLRTGIYDTYNGGAIMATEEVTLAEILRDAGYTTGIFGKWHLGDTYPHRPMDQGFTRSLIHPAGGMGQVGDVYNYFEYDRAYFDPTLLRDGHPVSTQGYCSDVFADGALDFITENRDRPFFLYLSFNAPHTPLQVPEEYRRRYADLVFDPERYKDAGGLPEMTDQDAESARRVYAMVTNIDDNVGRLRAHLDRLGLSKRTILVFLTDNGPQQSRFNGGLRGRKGTVYEGGIRVPFFLHAPGRWPENRDVDVAAAHIDVLPTIVRLAGIDLPAGLELDGRDLTPAVSGADDGFAERPLFFYWQRGMPEPYRNVAVRRGRYKLVGQTGPEAKPTDFELFDLQDDPFEQQNLAPDHPDVAESMKDTFDPWYRDVIASPHLGTQRLVLGSPFENPVILQRNDAKGTAGLWAQKKIYGFWDVTVADAGRYDITAHFEGGVPGRGELAVRVGRVQRTFANDDSTAVSLTLADVPLVAGDARFEIWYWHAGSSYLPFYVTVERKGGERAVP